MKKLTAILLIALLFFNFAGYRLFFDYLQAAHRISFEASLDKNEYDDSKLLEIRIPLSMPYLSAESGYERIDGEISIDGRSYKYVKRKVEQGQLILLCIADSRNAIIEHARSQFGCGTSELPLAAKKSSESSGKIVVASEYDDVASLFLQDPSVSLKHVHVDGSVSLLTPGYPHFAERPPRPFLP